MRTRRSFLIASMTLGCAFAIAMPGCAERPGKKKDDKKADAKADAKQSGADAKKAEPTNAPKASEQKAGESPADK